MFRKIRDFAEDHWITTTVILSAIVCIAITVIFWSGYSAAIETAKTIERLATEVAQQAIDAETVEEKDFILMNAYGISK